MANYEAQNYIVTNGLVLNLDAGDPDSYTRSQPPYVEVLVVAGGGGGGSHVGGGGGAGGLIYNTAYQLTNAAAITVTVGGGGSGGSSDARGSNGSNSIFGSLTATGGGGGGSWGGAGNPDGQNGGSGGGAAGTDGVQFAVGGTATAGQGNNGGNVGPRSGGNSSGVGGGGAGAASLSRADASDPTQINGGAGLPFSILGTSYYFAGGGGGGSYLSVAGGNGGAGGGGGGASTSGTPGTGDTQSINAANNGNVGSGASGGTGATNSGGGGGAGSGGAAGVGVAGGSGIVIVRYPGLPAATGGTITYLNGYTIHTFTSSGTFTPYLWNDLTGTGYNPMLSNNVFNPPVGTMLFTNGIAKYLPGGTLTDFPNTPSSNATIVILSTIKAPDGDWKTLIRGAGADHQVIIDAGDGVTLGMYDNNGSGFISSGFDFSTIADRSTAYHVYFWKLSTSSPYYQFYYDTNTSSPSGTITNANATFNSGFACVGAYHDGSSDPNAFSQEFGDIKVFLYYNRHLSQAEMDQVYNALKNRR
jgi:hypothetical protein